MSSTHESKKSFSEEVINRVNNEAVRTIFRQRCIAVLVKEEFFVSSSERGDHIGVAMRTLKRGIRGKKMKQ